MGACGKMHHGFTIGQGFPPVGRGIDRRNQDIVCILRGSSNSPADDPTIVLKYRRDVPPNEPAGSG
jgi:hypothetical protein